MSLEQRIFGSKEDRAWAAGFFDGEGTSSVVRNHKKKAIYPAFKITQCANGHEILSEFARIVGCGNVYGPKQPKNLNHSPYWVWSVSGLANYQTTLGVLWPWLKKSKRDQAIRVMTEVNTHWAGRKARGETNKVRRKIKSPYEHAVQLN